MVHGSGLTAPATSSGADDLFRVTGSTALETARPAQPFAAGRAGHSAGRRQGVGFRAMIFRSERSRVAEP
jgi:hypothetical protein